jgi:superoxide dismutase, Cu-Zn family
MILKSPIYLAFLLASGQTLAMAQAQVPAPRIWTVEGQAPAISAAADIIDLTGKSIGSAQFRQGPHGVLIDVQVSGITPGAHGAHFHATGQCDATTKFASAAHHMGLDAKPHGVLHPKDHHAGDLPNIIAHADGSAAAQFYTSDIRISGKASKGQMMLLDADGSSLIIHEKADDGFTQPSGGAGGRIACGTLKLF